ncbi:MAG: DUF2935 domain-containing protein [Anaerolineaceae bacterium]|nr:MAG: DUF2935 domain-containing protein [Anaerolineaceae bacterium]
MDGTRTFEITLMEHRFWLQIMGDHARFIFFSLSPNEVVYLQRSQDFIIGFDQLLDQTANATNTEELALITKQAFQLTMQLREFKLLLLSLTLSSDIKIHLTSSFINDMLNELDEYLTVLHSLNTNQPILYHPLHYHLLWLTDAIGHAASVSANLDFIEKDIIDKSNYYELQFTDLLLKATMMNGYLRIKLDNFPSLNRLNKQVEILMTSFKEFLEELRDERMNGQILGTLFPLMADHMAREECYYLWKLTQTAGMSKKPDCNPASPRIEG